MFLNDLFCDLKTFVFILKLLDLVISQEPTMFFTTNMGEADRFGPTHNPQLYIKKSIVFQTTFDLAGFAYVSKLWDSIFYFQFAYFQEL